MQEKIVVDMMVCKTVSLNILDYSQLTQFSVISNTCRSVNEAVKGTHQFEGTDTIIRGQ